MNHLSILLKSLRDLGLKSLTQYAIYKFGLVTGHYRRLTRKPSPTGDWSLNPVLLLPPKNELLKVLGKEGQAKLLAEADEVVEGKVRLFGGEPVLLDFASRGNLAHWTDYETGKVPFPASEYNDVKFLWEPARFGWAFILGRAYLVSQDERYPKAFWENTEIFLQANPPYLGPQWTSAQEVALRLMALVWAGQVLSASPESTPERMNTLVAAIAAHAERIPPTMIYARAQNNNHLLSEAAALYTAALALPHHPQSESWRSLGWKWLEWSFKKQILKDGSYVQHSANYQRLMLQLALWIWTLANLSPARRGGTPQKIEAQLASAAKWLSSLTDRESGQAVNLGANDGAYIFPLTICSSTDYRPVVQAASLAFTGEKPFRDGPWNEMALWFGQKLSLIERYAHSKRPAQKFILESRNSWAYLRAVKFRNRPSHADQLHLDLWWHGYNVARDAGTYLYNADRPWDNSLTVTFVHNTISVDGREQMTRAGRFLYLDWALGGIIDTNLEADPQWMTARQHGYKKIGIVHQRKVMANRDDGWVVEDEMMAKSSANHVREFRLHWLLPDWEWELDDSANQTGLAIKSPLGWVRMVVTSNVENPQVTLVRSGERIYGEGPALPQYGWFSPTYGQKIPALSFSVLGSSSGPVKFRTEFSFPKQ